MRVREEAEEITRELFRGELEHETVTAAETVEKVCFRLKAS